MPEGRMPEGCMMGKSRVNLKTMGGTPPPEGWHATPQRRGRPTRRGISVTSRDMRDGIDDRVDKRGRAAYIFAGGGTADTAAKNPDTWSHAGQHAMQPARNMFSLMTPGPIGPARTTR